MSETTQEMTPELSRGSSGEWVTYLQQCLEHLGYQPGSIDGEFGPRTEQAVAAFQAAYGLSEIGRVDSATWSLLTGTTLVNEAEELVETAADGSGTAATAEAFVQLCLAQEGDDYDYGVDVDLDDPDPSSFDCAELVEWALSQLGVLDGLQGDWNWSQGQRAAIEAAGLSCSVDEARSVPGALLFNSHHVAVSLGDGTQTIEAMGEQWNVRKGKIDGKSGSRFDGAGRVPMLQY
jgi:Putative peptidoglycan binding domain